MKTRIIPVLLLVSSFSGFAQDPCISRTWKNSYLTSWLLNDGGVQANHIQHTMDNIFVRSDGMVATVTGWDEGGSNVIAFSPDGKIKSIPEGSGTGGYGRMSMTGVVLDKNYIYQLLSQNGCDGAVTAKNRNNLPQYPKCGDQYTWKTVRRYNISNGLSAPFSNGYGYKGDMLIVHSGIGDLNGIAIIGDNLIVSDERGDTIRVYNKNTLSSVPEYKYHINGGVGQLSPDNHGCLWMLQPETKKIIRFNRINGDLQSQEITFPDSVIPSAFFVDTLRNRILVADNGITQNIRIYGNIYTNPHPEATFGNTFGIFSDTGGKYGPLKFFDLKGVGVDSAGNIYVANSVVGGGSVLQAYKPDGSMLWDRMGLAFTATASADPKNVSEVYTFDKKVKMDYSKTAPGTEWSFDAYTLNRFKYPDDPRIHGGFFTSSWIKYIDGRKFLFATDMYASQLAGFRFSPGSEVAIPCLLMNVGGWDINSNYPVNLGAEKDFIWMDKNGDGSIQSDEFTFKEGFDNPFSMSVWVDSAGNIWKGVREKGVRFIPLTGVNDAGVPLYDFAGSRLIDISNGASGTNGVKRLVYDAETDELFIAGFSDEKPDVKANGQSTDTWWCMGSTICMYNNILDTLKKNPDTDFKNIKPAWRMFVPFAADGETGSEKDSKSFVTNGDYVFVALARYGLINVYKRSNGEYLGQIKPGDAVNRESGWTDINYSINVYQRGNETLIFNEENAFGKVILYRVSSFETNDLLYPDLVPADLKLINRQGDVITELQPDEPVRFVVTVKNQGPGLSPGGSNYTGGKSILVDFTVKNTITKEIKTFVSDTCTSSLQSGDSITFTSFSTNKPFEWMAEKGSFEIAARINPLSVIYECHKVNNVLSLMIDSYDTVVISKHPVSATINTGENVSFSVEAFGKDPLHFQWLINNQVQEGINQPVLFLTDVSYNLNQAAIKVVVSNDLGSDTSNMAVLTVLNPYGESKPGFLLQQKWNGITGTRVSDLKNNTNYPNNPDAITYINKYEVATNIGDQYGVRVSGWLLPPVTGNYVFYFASDDNGELWLSTDSLKENLGEYPIAWVSDWTDPREYTKFPDDQCSDTIFLEGGRAYYTAAFFKEQEGGDNMAVCWRLPDGTMENPIPSSRLAFYTDAPVVTSNPETDNSSEMMIFPVPAESCFYIRLQEANGPVILSITDISGHVVKLETIDSSGIADDPVDVSYLRSGLYIVTVINRGKMVHAKLLISK